MTLLLTLVGGPHPQPVRQMRLEDGTLVIGRSAEADWHIEDPDMFVSRAHCTVVGRGDRFIVTDTSTGGLFLDNGLRPLGTGNSAPLAHGSRLRLGDYVLQVELQAEAPSPEAAPPRRADTPFGADDFFATPSAAAPRPVRPAGLPDPFDQPRSIAPAAPAGRSDPPPAFDDPFTLDPPRSTVRPASGFAWDDAPAAAQPRERERPPPEDWPAPQPIEPRAETPAPAAMTAPGSDTALTAFLRGLGLDPADAPAGDPLARIEAFGREYRMMVEGLMHLLRKRAEEKGNARIVRTVIGGAEVSPLKFMPTVEDALAVMIAARSSGFSDTEAAIAGAVRDLAEHHVSTWRGLQGALNRMLDRFDPKALETELAGVGTIETLLAGGRRAKLWELYEKRFRDIAQSAETRFLGELGADFREAYEREEKTP